MTRLQTEQIISLKNLVSQYESIGENLIFSQPGPAAREAIKSLGVSTIQELQKIVGANADGLLGIDTINHIKDFVKIAEVSQELGKEITNHEPNTQGDYKMSATMIGLKEQREGQNSDIAWIELTIKDPNGAIIASVPARSGGFENGMLPGLINDLDGDHDNDINAQYHVQKPTIDLNYFPIKDTRFHGENGQAMFLRLLSPDYVERGAHKSSPESVAFGIHPDGNSGLNSNDGSGGCLAIDTKYVDKFINAWNKIPPDQRPKTLDILESSDPVEISYHDFSGNDLTGLNILPTYKSNTSTIEK